MPLPVPDLDDRRFQDIVDEAKRLIPHYCPEWTDHNVSDPGVTLIELFAWMTDLLLYRVNQVPDKVYIKFLEMIGVRLDPPRPASCPVTFYLSAAQPLDVLIPEGTEVATVQTETSPAIVFTTEDEFSIRPAHAIGAFTGFSSRGSTANWTEHDLRRLDLPGEQIPLFSSQPPPGEAFYLALERDHSHHVLALVVDCEVAGGAGIDPRDPPIEWQVWQGGMGRWAACELAHDGTGGFNWPGEIILHLPTMARAEFHGQDAHWLRCRLTARQGGSERYDESPNLRNLRVEARGGTVGARHAITIQDELLGQSDGSAGQTFHLQHTPILARDPRRDCLVVKAPRGEEEQWEEVGDFADSGEGDRHYTLDSLDGTLALGPALLQPSGLVSHFGATPEKGSLLHFTRYQHGGGVVGNLQAGALQILKSSIPYVSRVENREPAQGGREAETLEDAKVRAPQQFRMRTRAVTADDYEYLAGQVEGVERASCLSPGQQPGGPNDPKPGQVRVIVLPKADTTNGRISAAPPPLSTDVRDAVLATLNSRRLVGIAEPEVRQAQYVQVSVRATLFLPERTPAAVGMEVRQRAESALYRYLSPYGGGGPHGTGWPFGRDLYQSEIYSLLLRVPGVEFVEDVQIRIAGSGDTGMQPAASGKVSVARDAVICSQHHEVLVR